jgi:hypothetical protein
VRRSGLVEARHHVGRLEHDPCARADQEPGMVIEHVQDLDVGPVGEPPVGGVGLPALVRHRRLEAHERALGSLLRLGAHEPTALEDPPYRRDRGRRSMPTFQMERDRVRSRIQAFVGERLAQLDDFLLERVGDLVRTYSRPARPRLQASLTLGLEPTDQLVDPASGDPVVTGHLRLGASLQRDCGDHEPCKRHPSTP